MKYLIVVDMQKDFITGSLGSEMATAIVPNVVDKVKGFDGRTTIILLPGFERLESAEDF